MEVITELKLTIKVPIKRVDEVSQRILDLLAELDVFNGEFTQSNATVDI